MSSKADCVRWLYIVAYLSSRSLPGQPCFQFPGLSSQKDNVKHWPNLELMTQLAPDIDSMLF